MTGGPDRPIHPGAVRSTARQGLRHEALPAASRERPRCNDLHADRVGIPTADARVVPDDPFMARHGLLAWGETLSRWEPRPPDTTARERPPEGGPPPPTTLKADA